LQPDAVASRAEAWIETPRWPRSTVWCCVASRAEAWIETDTSWRASPCRAVASRAEAWIETAGGKVRHGAGVVASRAEAWIETDTSWRASPCRAGRLPRGGVDRNYAVQAARLGITRRLPRGGVDRNPPYPSTTSSACGSPPARRRGSKQRVEFGRHEALASPPARRRGSKQCALDNDVNGVLVASRAEAWIETSARAWCGRRRAVASRAEAWIETTRRRVPKAGGSGRLPRGGVDRNCKKGLYKRLVVSRLPRGGVDRNAGGAPASADDFCRLPRGGVDRNLRGRGRGGPPGGSPPARRRGSKQGLRRARH